MDLVRRKAKHAGDNALIEAISKTVQRVTGQFDRSWLETGLSHGFEAAAPIADGDFEPLHEPHWHTFVEACFCLEGRCLIRQGDSDRLLGEGDACLLLPETVHCEMPDARSRYEALWIAIGYNRVVVHLLIKEAGRSAELLESRPYIADSSDSHILHRLLAECKQRKPHWEVLVKSYTLELLLHSLRRFSEEGTRQSSIWKEDIVREVRAYAERNYGRQIRISDISHELCISGNHLNTIFKAATGTTIMRYIEEFKLEKAREWLEQTGDSVQEIAFRLGFYDAYHFSRTFKKETGLSPSQYRADRRDAGMGNP